MIEMRQSDATTFLATWGTHNEVLISRYGIVGGDSFARTPFPHGHFDQVFLMVVSELPLDSVKALAELERITCQAAHVISSLDPTWSCAYGQESRTDPNLNFAFLQLLARLQRLSTCDDIQDWYLSMGYSQSIAESVLQ
jgi:hypothetical protein